MIVDAGEPHSGADSARSGTHAAKRLVMEASTKDLAGMQLRSYYHLAILVTLT